MVQWALMTLLDPKLSLANLIYIGYKGNPAAALRVTRKRSLDRKKQTTERNVFQCYVFGSKHAGKSALLYSLLGRQASEPIFIINVLSMLFPFLLIHIGMWNLIYSYFLLFSPSKATTNCVIFTGLFQIIILQQQLSSMRQMSLN